MKRMLALIVGMAVAVAGGCLQTPAPPSPQGTPNPPAALRSNKAEPNAGSLPEGYPRPLVQTQEPQSDMTGPPYRPFVQDNAPQPDRPQPRTSEAPPSPAVQPPAAAKPTKPPVRNAGTSTGSKTTQARRLTLSQLSRKYPQYFKLRGSSGEKQVALTFDDAPDSKYTAQILDVLREYDVKATFFLIGSSAEKHPELVKRIVKEGHTVGNHSYNHQLFTRLSDDAFREQVQKTQQSLNRLAGYAPKLLRPPYGEISESQLLWAAEHGLLVVNWNIDSLDWKQLNQAQILSNVMNSIKPGSIVLQHSGGGPRQDLSGTVKALPQIIETLRSQGYRLVTVPELLNVPKQQSAQ